MAVLCCGFERTTPHCPSCGTKLSEPAPLVTLLKHLKTQLAKAEKPFEGMLRQNKGSQNEHWWHPEKGRIYEGDYDKLVAKRDEWKRWVTAVEAAIANDDVPRRAVDWLIDNGFHEAAARLLGAFTGKQAI